MIRLFTLSFLCSFSTFAQADFTGAWIGTGHIVDGGGGVKNCESMAFNVEQTAADLKISSKITCGGEMIDPLAGKMKINGTDLISSTGVKIGTISDSSFAFNVTTPDFAIDAKVARSANNTLTFVVKLKEMEQPQYTIIGELKK